MAPQYRGETATPPPAIRTLPARRGTDRPRQKPSTGDQAMKAVKIKAKKDVAKAHAETIAIARAAQENILAQENEIQSLRAMLASINEKELRENLEKQLDQMARGSKAATEEVQKIRESSVDAQGDTNMDDQDDQAEGSGQATTDVEDPEAPNIQAIEKKLDEELKHLPQPINQRFYADEFHNLKAVDTIAAPDICPVAKQTIEIDDRGTKETIKYLVRYGEPPNCIYRFLKATEIAFDDSITAGLPTFPTPKYNARKPKEHPDGIIKSDLKHLSNVAFHGSPGILCDDGLARKQTKNGARYPDTYVILEQPGGKLKFATRTIFNQLHGNGKASIQAANEKILNCARAAQLLYHREAKRRELLEEAQNLKSEDSSNGVATEIHDAPIPSVDIVDVEAGQDTNQNSSNGSASLNFTGPSNGANNSSGSPDASGNQGRKRPREDTPEPTNDSTNQSTAQLSGGASQEKASSNQTSGGETTEAAEPAAADGSAAEDKTGKKSSKTEKPPTKAAKTSHDPDAPIPSVETDHGQNIDDKASVTHLPTPPSSQSPQPPTKET